MRSKGALDMQKDTWSELALQNRMTVAIIIERAI